MAYSDSMFLFELAVEELKSFAECKNYRILAKFCHVFSLRLRDPNEAIADTLRMSKKAKRKLKLRQGNLTPPKITLPSGQTVLIASDIESLVTNMMKYPLELRLYGKEDRYTLGLAEIPWSSVHFDYLNNLESTGGQPPAIIREKYKVYDEYTSKRIAVVKLKIQLTLLKENIPIPIKNNDECKESTTHTSPQSVSRESEYNPVVETGNIKTYYKGKQRKPQSIDETLLKLKDSVVDCIAEKEEIIFISNPSSEPHIGEQVYEPEATIQNKDDNIENIDIKSLYADTVIHKESSVNVLMNVEKTNDIFVTEHNDTNLASFVRSQTELDNNRLFAVTKHWSSTSLEIKQRLDTLNYIFGNLDGPFGNKVYCVGYFTVENEMGSDNTGATTPTPNTTSNNQTSTKESGLPGSGKYSFKICGSQCKLGNTNPCFENICSLDLPEEAAHLINVRKCTRMIECEHKKERGTLSSSDEPILIDLSHRKIKDCCENVEQVIGGMQAEMKVGDDPCFCTCSCTFGFIKKTTYCDICGGYELVGQEVKSMRQGPPFPCPYYHNLVDKSKKPITAETKRKTLVGGTIASAGHSDKRASVATKRSIESVKETKKGKKKKKDDRFKFNYGYKGIPPQIGHSQCAMPCTGTLYPVPKHMGWLWTADNIPGLKTRPNWRPGAANKHVVRMLKIARYPEEAIAKRRRRDTGKKKRPLKRPLLIVQKKDGEYTVTMETMKIFNKPRAINQCPYEDKPVLTYTVGRTDEENMERQKRKERAKRRLERDQRAFIQSAFHDMCKEICLKTYQQALGILPFAEDPACTCYPEETDPDRVDPSHSCSCTESTMSSGSATDDDEWIVEFTPPNAFFNPAIKIKKLVKVDTSTQYTYLDYRVKLLDRFGNPVPRFFIGPDGRQQCSDLGGFWGPDKKWLEINFDGYVAPDGRWAPNNFIGPCGETVDAEAGKFQATNGVWLVVGIDGYVDCKGQWRFYPKPREVSKDPKKSRNVEAWKKAGGCKEGTWSCFGDASPRTLSQMGIMGHGHDRRLLLSTLEKMMAQGEDVRVPQTSQVPRLGKRKARTPRGEQSRMFTDRMKCKHSTPSEKGIMAVDDRGHKTYFRLRDHKNPRPKDRLVTLGKEGISVSSFHVPCFSSFISSEAARQQQYEHILRHNERIMQSTAAPYGWRPGAISKRLLQKLNQAKLNRSIVARIKRTKKLKKPSSSEEKPTLIVAKRNGEYIVEMQTFDETSEGKEPCKPLIYKIASANNEEKIRKRELKTQRLIDKTAEKIWSDPYHPEVCETTCLKAYKQAIGLLPYDPNNPECICPEDMQSEATEEEEVVSYEDDSSDCSSLDVDWELHFTPPGANRV
ncbi:uncharacterized protein LOC126367669 [Pectinophora gossypiella]|uniref:uncharacterized protein LOC126367669 n=1 Tax=Pectinophora gossypiella TaxID=13191 RepID=UPI00214E4D10|nr:uncharacterized protein LOC126367669 [Pectinophora gossypiella]